MKNNFKNKKKKKRRKKAWAKKNEWFKATKAIYIKPISLRPLPTFEELSFYKEEQIIKDKKIETLHWATTIGEGVEEILRNLQWEVPLALKICIIINISKEKKANPVTTQLVEPYQLVEFSSQPV
jgi:hypothetical protein